MTMQQVRPQDSLYNTGGGSLNGGMINKGLGIQPRTLSDWLVATSGGQRTAQYGYFGPGHLLRKDITSAGDGMIAGDFFVNTFGAKVWDSLNSQTRFFNLLRKVAWGNTTGWRIRSGRNNSTQGVGEQAALPTIDTPDLQTVYIQPSFVVTSLGVSALAQFLATLEGGMGDALAVAQESAEVDHLKSLNQMLMNPSEIRIADAANITTADAGVAQTLVTGAGERVSVGDKFSVYAAAGGTRSGVATVVSVSGDTVNLKGDSAFNVADDAVMVAESRAGFTSISDVINEDGRVAGGLTGGMTGGVRYGNLTHNSRSSGGWNAAGYVSGNSGNLRHLTTGHLDRVIQQIRVNGFQPDLLVTGVEQEVRLGTILQANQHFIGEGTFQVKQGGESTLPGYETGFEISTYKKIPLFTDTDMAPVWQLPTNGDAVRGTDVMVLDTRYLELPVLFTTQYMESRDYIHNNLLGIKAIFLTAANLRCLNFRAQGRVTDLSDGINLT